MYHQPKRILQTFAVIVATAAPAIANAQVKLTTPSSVRNFSDVGGIITKFFNITIGVSAIIFVALLLFGGVQYLLSLGVEDAVTKARKLMLNALIGLVIVVTSWGIGNYVLRLLGIQVNLTGGVLDTGSFTSPSRTGGITPTQQQQTETTVPANSSNPSAQETLPNMNPITVDPLTPQSELPAGQGTHTVNTAP